MKYLFIGLFLSFAPLFSIAQDLTGTELLERSIAYHDPSGNWNTFNGAFKIQLEMPDTPQRLSEVTIDLPGEYFNLSQTKENRTTQYTLNRDDCAITVCTTGDVDHQGVSDYKSECEKARLYKNYYTYLYGLPMKLKDPGTLIERKVERKEFKGKEYLVLKVTYKEAVGKEVWFFYFNPKSYAMELYQFFKGDPEKEGKDTGEYIVLSEEKMIQGIKMPKIRVWYYNKDNGYLGTDILQ
jgi:hypothetical protein